jgi:hypothetical protein
LVNPVFHLIETLLAPKTDAVCRCLNVGVSGNFPLCTNLC